MNPGLSIYPHTRRLDIDQINDHTAGLLETGNTMIYFLVLYSANGVHTPKPDSSICVTVFSFQ